MLFANFCRWLLGFLGGGGTATGPSLEMTYCIRAVRALRGSNSARLSFVFLALSAFACAQRATLSGTVSDPKGGLLKDVAITLLNLDQGLKRESATNDEGSFYVPWLQPGRYVVTAQKDGFAIAEVKDVVLHVGDSHILNVQMQVGAPLVEIEVQSTLPLVETISPGLGQIVTGEVIRNAPLNGRNVLDLALLMPGVTPPNPDDVSPGRLNVAGARADSIAYLLDGGLNNDQLDNSVVYNPNPDTVAEFRILTSNYPAEFGRNSGGVVSVVVRSGTNDFHGSAFDFLRNDALDANSFFNKNDPSGPLPRDVLKRNQFGGTLGGPIRRNHSGNGGSFFFLGYQGQRQTQSTAVHNRTTFTQAELNGDFSQSGVDSTGRPIPDPALKCFLSGQPSPNALDPYFCRDANNNPLPPHPFYQPDSASQELAIIDRNRIDPVALNYISAGLVPTAAGGQLSAQQNAHLDRDELTGRFDFDITAKDKLAITLGSAKVTFLDPFPYATVPGYPDRSNGHNFFSNFAYTKIIRPTLVNEFRFTAQRSDIRGYRPAVQLPRPQELGVGVTPDSSNGPTRVVFDQGTTILGFSPQGPQDVTDNTFSFTDALTWVRGRHHWKFGGGFAAYQNNTLFAFNTEGQFDFIGGGGSGSGNAFADFLLGLPTFFSQDPAADSNVRSKLSSFFAQDEWRVNTTLVVTLGLRYEYSTPKKDTMGRTFSLSTGQRSTVFTNAPVSMVFPGDPGVPRGVNFPDRNDWAPRLGFAWDMFGKGKVSLRGGIGIFYDVLKAEDNFQFNGQPPFFSSVGFTLPPLAENPSAQPMYMSDPFAVAGVPDPFPSRIPPSDIDFAAAGFLPIGSSNSLFFVDEHLRTPYTYQYNLSLQREIASNMVAEASYVGSTSRGLTALQDVNPMVLGSRDRALNLLPGNTTCHALSEVCSFATLREFRNLAQANYNGLELSLQKRIAGDGLFGGSYFTFAYTYSHNIDTASGFRNRNSLVPAYMPEYLRSSADMDVRHRLVFSGGWELPFNRAWSDGPRRLTEGWSLFPIISWRSGFPFDVFANLPATFDFTDPGPSGAGDPDLVRANLIGDPSINDPAHARTFGGDNGFYYFNPLSFSNAQCPEDDKTVVCTPGPAKFPSGSQAMSDPAVRTYGTLPRNFLRGPGRFNIDLSIAKVTPITERIAAEFRADIFNVLNNAQFNDPNTNISDPNFGKVQDTAPPRIIQLAVRVTF